MLDPATVAATFVAGLASFLAPCTVPLLPAYMSAVSGVGAAELASPAGHSSFRSRLVAGSALYVAGFSTVLVVLGITAGSLGGRLGRPTRVEEIAGGLVVAAFGLAILGVLRLPWVGRARTLDLGSRLRRRGLPAAFLVGAVFALGWSPCAGPYLGAALTLAASGGHAAGGAVLLLAYALGLGLPFIAAALLWGSVPDLPRRLSRWAPAAVRVGGALTVALGLLVATGGYARVTSALAGLSTGH